MNTIAIAINFLLIIHHAQIIESIKCLKIGDLYHSKQEINTSNLIHLQIEFLS